MKKKVLFSPVGTTDPVSGCYDGAMIHICRKYRPEKVYLYLSREMLGNRNKDDRYRYSLRKLGEKIGVDFQVEEILRPELENVQRFDLFYQDFHEELAKIRDRHPDVEILLNISSGTPAMKSALQVMAAFDGMKFRAIQVDSPNKSSNPRREDIGQYQPADVWEQNIDNEGEYSDRTVESVHLNLSAKIKKEMIIKHLLVYDYHAAWSIAQEILDHLSKDSKILLEAATARIQLDQSGMDKILSGTDYVQELIPIRGGDERGIVEFVLWLQIKLKRKDYADFVRGITPVVADLLEMYLEKKLQMDMGKYFPNIQPNKRTGIKVAWLTRKNLAKDEKGLKILQALDEYYKNKYNNPSTEYKDSVYGADQMTAIAERFTEDNPSLKQAILDIRTVEEKIRNLAAHEIISITPDWIWKRCQMKPEQIMNSIKELAMKSGLSLRKTDWDSYDQMNQRIRKYLQE